MKPKSTFYDVFILQHLPILLIIFKVIHIELIKIS